MDVKARCRGGYELFRKESIPAWLAREAEYRFSLREEKRNIAGQCDRRVAKCSFSRSEPNLTPVQAESLRGGTSDGDV